MTTRSDIKNIMAYMGMAFPNYKPILDGEVNAVDVLFDLLGDIDIQSLKTAVQACCSEPGRAFAPSAGEIRGMIADMRSQSSGLPTAAEAWGAIMDCFRGTGMESQRLLEIPIVKEAIRCMGGMGSLGASEDNMADRAHFLKMFGELRDRAIKNVAQLPQVTAFIDQQKQISDGSKKLIEKLNG